MLSRTHPLPVASEQRRGLTILGTLAVLSAGVVLLACSLGSVPLSPGELAAALGELLRDERATLAATLLELRLGRALSAFVTGAALALGGVMMQALLRNPLADPYVLGVSGGASVGALAAILFFSAAWMVDAAAFVGAMAVALLLFLLAHRDLRGSASSEGSAPMLLLTGVIVASGCGALVTLMLSIASDNRLRDMVFWLIGDLSTAQFRWLPWLLWGGVLALGLRMARALNMLAMHAEAAAAFGVRVGAMRKALFIFSALLTASAVSTAGSIGFVGLIVPHACRFAWGPDHRLLLPAATLAGGSFLVLADTLARTVVAPQQLPVGVITALVGVPVFLIQLHQQHRR
ncbi:MAG TPA: iron ABC transporter permease [Noviherbaspirillum sp.]|jgi:iron complex transport system permease protein|uniref:FecCD family ABC transporter permease n=1 Tax=Noviherbaspirillum sp. TaxID=1926288 RepID=UPI002F93534A